MTLSFPWVLWFLPLAFIPLIFKETSLQYYSWNEMIPKDRLSSIIAIILKFIATLILITIIVGLSGPHSQQREIEKTGIGAQIGLVLDRSASMDDPFAGNDQSKVGEMKSAAAARLITDFVSSRKNDMMGMVSFSNSAMYVLPLTDNKNAIIAAVRATAGNALFQTNIGSGLTTGAELFNKVPDSGSRAVILLSDGAGRIDAATQEKIKDWFGRLKISLYWIVLRQPGGISIFNTSFKARDDEALPPQIELNEFFKSLNSPFQAYEAEDPKTLQKAIEDINQKEKKPIKYFEKIPGQDYSTHCFVTAALLMIALLTLKLIEVRSWL
ncbi:VWA domain-containing protein [Candidatus Methylopumilus universalis]|uniref:VWA domain-containing protein n=1 Tax=Candidatus Methylopumilus universalis TaxID=2588536 RepID=A0AAX1EYV4_9PROT|nr:vWA domain-containing protein [Candidatus Methylopumilus universalis]QDC40995.1 VWA domain-containing protein [Candidatus Methylopumilus universalis]QDC42286.1 VWA domain-containing protein [Candidatus Methylopumilus universalis]QDC54672.1 VWA domain-containing protein [Candidatus Methylopumilus universalis]QDC55952.1 VWA domain-containing protein [Candidatus Methylopumilus universalis]QDC57235.1 VWA domain-containing protein [Candidatus Methylopumilus universalis]